MRRVLITFSQPALTEWLQNHPRREDPEAPVWLSLSTKNRGEPLGYEAARMALQRLKERSGLKKTVNPHMFRHSRATSLSTIMTEAQMSHHLGWVPGTRMAATYVHLAGRDVDHVLLRQQGLLKDDDEHPEPELKVRACQICSEKNSPTSTFCTRCGRPLDLKTAIQMNDSRNAADEIMNRVFQDEKVRRIISQKIREIVEVKPA
jgi:predicted amidophosphoribosyltransferase